MEVSDMRINAGFGGSAAASARHSTDDAEDARLRKACEELETVFIEYLIREMRKTVPRDEIFGGGRGEEVFQGMFDQEIAKKMSARGGIGLGEILYEQLSAHAARARGSMRATRSQNAD